MRWLCKGQKSLFLWGCIFFGIDHPIPLQAESTFQISLSAWHTNVLDGVTHSEANNYSWSADWVYRTWSSLLDVESSKLARAHWSHSGLLRITASVWSKTFRTDVFLGHPSLPWPIGTNSCCLSELWPIIFRLIGLGVENWCLKEIHSPKMVEARGCSLWPFPVGALAKVRPSGRSSGAGWVFLLDFGPDWGAAGRYVADWTGCN